uniref:Uncharacterized protein n=1 Tax=Heterorhabditis bacteriophora TaxID=37862 RepID=A0A1I7WE10_HETBA
MASSCDPPLSLRPYEFDRPQFEQIYLLEVNFVTTLLPFGTGAAMMVELELKLRHIWPLTFLSWPS